jgi:hypothetical protein
MEDILRFVSAAAVLVAAVLTTISWRKWAHPLIRPGMAYSAAILWVISIYRWWLFLGHIEPNTEPARFIRLFVSVSFAAVAVGFAIHALATREFYRRNYLISKEPTNHGTG